MCELSDFETEHISSGDLIFNCGTQLLLQKGTSRTRPSRPHPFLWPMKSLSNQDTLALEFLMAADIKRPFFCSCIGNQSCFPNVLLYFFFFFFSGVCNRRGYIYCCRHLRLHDFHCQ